MTETKCILKCTTERRKMKDRYLFKAKRKDNGEWVVGSLISMPYGGYMIDRVADNRRFRVMVNPSTICQCTGLKDKNGNLIWENNIVRDKHGNFYKAFWQNNYYQFSWICVKSDVFPIGSKWDLWSFKSFEIEVIGNIFDNPELLESEERI